MQQGKATRAQLKEHNRQLILSSVFNEVADNRAALSLITGLAKPTISDIVGDLIEDGYLIEVGRGKSTNSGGKRPRLLEFVAHAREIIGISISGNDVLALLSQIDGQLICEHHSHIQQEDGKLPIEQLIAVINALVSQTDAPLLGLGIGVSGSIDADNGVVKKSPTLGWYNLTLGDRLEQEYGVPCFVGNNTEFATKAQYIFNLENRTRNLVTLLIQDDIEIGIALKGQAYHHGGSIGNQPLSNNTTLQNQLSWTTLIQRMDMLKSQYPSSILTDADLSFLHLRYALALDDPIALAIYQDMSQGLGEALVWIINLIRPDHIAIAGDIADMGTPLLSRLQEHLEHYVSSEISQSVTLSLSPSPQLSAMGAIAQARQNLLGIS